jgi:hypothetical protein
MMLSMKYACITMDVEPDIHSLAPVIDLFGDRKELELFGRIFNERSLPITAFVVTRLLEEAPHLIHTAMKSLPIRFEVHSHSHRQDEPDSDRELDAAVGAFERFFGRAPRGYRAPNGLISPAGLGRLSDRGFIYDSSVFPSYRFDEYSYNNLSSPIQPFIFKTPREILEIPLGVIKGIRLVLCLSYIKLLGLSFYKALITLFGLPELVVFLCHPYDFTVTSSLHRIRGWKRYAHARNANMAMPLFLSFVEMLQKQGYQFIYIDELIEKLDRISLDKKPVHT